MPLGEFPIDCKESGYIPVLVVLNSTPNPKLAELERAFRDQNGEVYKGDAACEHLDNLAGPTMSLFLENYVRGPIDRLIAEAPQKLPKFVAKMSDNDISISIGDESLRIVRHDTTFEENQRDEAPEDIGDNIPG